jgi:hypothetical protein
MGVSDLDRNEGAGYLTNADEKEFADAVAGLLDDEKLWKEKKQQALALASELSISRMTERLLACYRLAIDDYKKHGLPRFHRRPWTPPSLEPSPVETDGEATEVPAKR